MVRAFIFASAVLALVATVSAVPMPDPVISVHANDHIGTGDITAKNIANGLIRLNNIHAHDIGKKIRIASSGKKRKRDEGEGAPIRISKAIGVKGSKKMAKPKGAKGAAPKK